MNLPGAYFPLHEPLLIFTALVSIILLSPFLFRIIRVPDVASFIIAGVLVGPYGLNILSRDSSIELLGTVGLLYLMFIAGLELDPEKLKTSKRNSIIFGIFTFIFPFLLGIIVSKYILQLEFNAVLLVSIMFSTHTLVAYPIVRKLGVSKDMAVLTAVGGTIITDTLVLMILSIIAQTFIGNSIGFQIFKTLILFGIYIFTIFYTYPKIAHWFFKNIKRDRPVHFLFVLFLISVSSALAELIGVEAIIGAFVAGLALNRSIPKNSLLMHHIDFVGNILFIPIFLIGIGMLINTKILFTGSYIWIVSLILIITAFAGKWLAAFFSQKILKFSIFQRNLLFGLSSSHAAATIAIILIGYEKHIIDISIFNGTILIILVSSLAATFITQKYAKKLVVSSLPYHDESQQERILVPISNPSSMANLIAIANSFQNSNSTDPVYVLSIVNDDTSTKENIIKIRESLENNISEFNHLNENLKVITRVDLNISSGILRAAKEYMVSDIVIGWSEKSTTSQRLFGSVFENLFNGLQTIYGIKMAGNIHDINVVIIYLPHNLEHEVVFASIVNKINSLPLKENSKLEFKATNAQCLNAIKAVMPKRTKHEVRYTITENEIPALQPESLYLLFIMRKQSISYNVKNNNDIQKLIQTNLEKNFIIIVPGFE